MSLFPWLKKTTSDYHFENIQQDIHCHLLPGIDDGSPDVETSLELLQGVYDAGFRRITCTPHILADLYRNTPESVNGALSELLPAAREAGIAVEINAAAEYMLDDGFLQLLRTKQPLLTISRNVILTELSFAMAPSNIEEMAFEINIGGYQPILAHPERYFYYHNNISAYHRLRDLGFTFQINLLSLTGHYGKPVKKAAHYFFDNNLADYVGTDMHHAGHLALLTNAKTRELIKNTLGDKVWNQF